MFLFPFFVEFSESRRKKCGRNYSMASICGLPKTNWKLFNDSRNANLKFNLKENPFNLKTQFAKKNI